MDDVRRDALVAILALVSHVVGNLKSHAKMVSALFHLRKSVKSSSSKEPACIKSDLKERHRLLVEDSLESIESPLFWKEVEELPPGSSRNTGRPRSCIQYKEGRPIGDKGKRSGCRAHPLSALHQPLKARRHQGITCKEGNRLSIHLVQRGRITS